MHPPARRLCRGADESQPAADHFLPLVQLRVVRLDRAKAALECAVDAEAAAASGRRPRALADRRRVVVVLVVDFQTVKE